MTNEEIKQCISEILPTATYDETGEFLTIMVSKEELRPFMQTLRNDEKFLFEFLFCLTCIDWKTHFMMVYHLLSRKHHHNIVVKVKLDDINQPEIDTICDIWKTAEYLEREVYDLFGVKFGNHPDLRRLFLDDNWPGYPLRKNYVDENMISI